VPQEVHESMQLASVCLVITVVALHFTKSQEAPLIHGGLLTACPPLTPVFLVTCHTCVHSVVHSGNGFIPFHPTPSLHLLLLCRDGELPSPRGCCCLQKQHLAPVSKNHTTWSPCRPTLQQHQKAGFGLFGGLCSSVLWTKPSCRHRASPVATSSDAGGATTTPTC
jgi:hypothetical protein